MITALIFSIVAICTNGNEIGSNALEFSSVVFVSVIAMAVLSGREYVVPGDIAEVFNDVLGHRVKLAARARANGMTVAEALDEVRSQVKVPRT